MKTLLLHDVASDAPYAAALEAAGHEVRRCSTAGRTRFPCDGPERGCPLDGTVDVAIVIHDRAATDISPGEAGAVCALRDGIPLVVAGNGAHNPFGDRVAAIATGPSDVAGACERAVAGRTARLGRLTGAAVELDGDCVRATLPSGSTGQDVIRAHRQLTQILPSARLINVGVAAEPEG